MTKTKFKLNPHSLELEKVKVSRKQWVKRFTYFGMLFVVLSSLVLFVAYSYFPTPHEIMLKRENEQYKLQYELLNNKVDKLVSVLGDIEDRDDNIYRTIFEAEPIPSEKRMAGIGGINRYKDLENYDNSKLIIETTKKIDLLSRRLYIQSKSFDDVYKMAKNKEKMMASIPAIQPISNKDLKRIASGFGYRIHPKYKTWRMHTGMDFSAPIGTPIYATGDGTVMRLRKSMRGYGKVIMIDHGFGYQTLYAHCSKLVARPGQKVKRGQLIGYVGNTGVSTGPHVHYEIRKNGKPINPVNFFYQDLTPEEYDKVIDLSSRANQSMS